MCRENKEAVEAVAQLIAICYGKEASQIADLEIRLLLHGATQLANIVRQQGLANAGGEYLSELEAIVRSQFRGEIFK